jgi:hypothetical protein
MIFKSYPDFLFFGDLTLVTSLRESLSVRFDWTLTVARGQRSNFAIFCPLVGLPLPLRVPHLSPHSFHKKLYKGETSVFTVY